MKKCVSCGKEKEENAINFKLVKGKLSNICRDCILEQHRKYNRTHRDLINAKSKERNSRPEVIVKNREYRKKYKEEHKEKIRLKNKEYNARPEVKQKRKEYLLMKKEHIKKVVKEYRIKNKEELNKKERERRRSDYIYRFKNNMRKLIDRSFNYIKKEKCLKTEEIIGLPADEFVNYLLDTYKQKYGYEWDKIEKVHIDHIIPLITANTEEDVIRLCHYTNLQLLKAKDNLIKGTKILE